MEQEWLIGVEYGRAGKGGITDRSNKHLGVLCMHTKTHDCRCDFKGMSVTSRFFSGFFFAHLINKCKTI